MQQTFLLLFSFISDNKQNPLFLPKSSFALYIYIYIKNNSTFWWWVISARENHGSSFPLVVCKLVKFLPFYEPLWLESIQEHKVQGGFLFFAFLQENKRRSVGISDYLSSCLPPPPNAHLMQRIRLERKISCAALKASLPAHKQVQEEEEGKKSSFSWQRAACGVGARKAVLDS